MELQFCLKIFACPCALGKVGLGPSLWPSRSFHSCQLISWCKPRTRFWPTRALGKFFPSGKILPTVGCAPVMLQAQSEHQLSHEDGGVGRQLELVPWLARLRLPWDFLLCADNTAWLVWDFLSLSDEGVWLTPHLAGLRSHLSNLSQRPVACHGLAVLRGKMTCVSECLTANSVRAGAFSGALRCP